MQQEQSAGGGRECERFGGAAPAFHRVTRRLDVDELEAPFCGHLKSRNRVVAAVGGEQKAPIRCENDASRTLKGVGRAFLATDWLEFTRSRTAGADALQLDKRAVCFPLKVNDCVRNFVGLRVEMPRLSFRS